MLPWIMIYGGSSISVVVLNVLTYVNLKRIARNRLMLGVRPAVVEECGQSTTQDQHPVCSRPVVLNEVGGVHNTSADFPRIEINRHSESSTTSIELNTVNPDRYFLVSPKVARKSFPDNQSQATSTPNIGTPQGTVNPTSNRTTEYRRKFKLTFLMSLRYLVTYWIAEMVASILYFLNEYEASLSLLYVFFVNGFGDYVLYGLFNPRYRDSHMKLHARFLAYCCIDLNSHPKLCSILSWLFMLS